MYYSEALPSRPIFNKAPAIRVRCYTEIFPLLAKSDIRYVSGLERLLLTFLGLRYFFYPVLTRWKRQQLPESISQIIAWYWVKLGLNV